MPLNRERVLEEALRLVDDDGLDALSLRTLAARLKVQAPTLYWHVKNKSELLDALADAIMDEAIAAVPDPGEYPNGREWLLEALGVLRGAVLRHPDGARIISGSRYSLRRADFSETAMAALVERGMDAQDARLLVLVGERFTVGWVLEEQSPAPNGPAPSVDELQARFPVASKAIGDYFAGTGRTADDLFRDGARLILRPSAASEP
ncbi:TetR family transcriptional regulator [Humibacter sp.]|uniref:TetR family transcriptional regulator n=1 Tax=Humibacter sp. TaxID=1940291 RepID=UPI003F803DB0